MREKQALTTGEVAKFCGVNFRTVIRWIERGHLEAYKLPGRGDNRIPVESFIAFLQQNNMPIPLELTNSARHLLVLAGSEDYHTDLASLARRTGWEVTLTRDPLQFGYLLAKQQPQAIIIGKEEQVQCVNKLLREIDTSELLLLWVNAEPGVSTEKNWLSIRWPAEQTKLAAALSQGTAE